MNLVVRTALVGLGFLNLAVLGLANSAEQCLIEVQQVGFNGVKFYSKRGREDARRVRAWRARRTAEGKVGLGREEWSWREEDLILDPTYPRYKFHVPLYSSDGFRGSWYVVCAEPKDKARCRGECALVRFCDCECTGSHRRFLRVVVTWEEAIGGGAANPPLRLTAILLPNSKAQSYMWDFSVEGRLSWLDCTKRTQEGKCPLEQRSLYFDLSHFRAVPMAKMLLFRPTPALESLDFRLFFSMNISDLLQEFPDLYFDEKEYSFELPTIILGRYAFRNTSVSLLIPFDNPGQKEQVREECQRLNSLVQPPPYSEAAGGGDKFHEVGSEEEEEELPPLPILPPPPTFTSTSDPTVDGEGGKSRGGVRGRGGRRGKGGGGRRGGGGGGRKGKGGEGEGRGGGEVYGTDQFSAVGDEEEIHKKTAKETWAVDTENGDVLTATVIPPDRQQQRQESQTSVDPTKSASGSKFMPIPMILPFFIYFVSCL